jgi:hypothetical protein
MLAQRAVAQTSAVNRLYDEMWLYYNFFQPVLRLTEKVVVPGADGQPTRIKRRHDQARTPFDRLCDTDAILPEHKDLLEALRDQTNPRQLRQDIYDLLGRVFALPGAVPEVTENVFQTLMLHPSSERQEDDSLTLSFNRTTILKGD